MQLEYLKVGRVYRVKQGRKLLILRLKNIQELKGVGTELYELKITTEGYRLWMLDENIGKGYWIENLAQIDSEIPEKPVPNSLVQIVKGVLTKSLGSVTVYRVKDVGVDGDTGKRTVTLYGPFKNYECWMDDVRVYEGKKVDPETLLSKESKAIGDKPKRFLPGPAVPQKTKLTAFLKPKTAFGSLTGEERKTKEDEEKEKLQADLDKKKEEYADQQHAATAIRKQTEKDLYQQGTAILKAAKKGKQCPVQEEELATSRSEQLSSKPTEQLSVVSERTVSKPSKPSPKPKGIRPASIGALTERQPKARKEKLTQAIKKNKNLRVKGRNKETEARMPAFKKSEPDDSEAERPARTAKRRGGMAVTVTPSSSGVQNIAPQTEEDEQRPDPIQELADTAEDGNLVDGMIASASRLVDEEDDSFDARMHKKTILEAPIPEYLNGVGNNVTMSGLEISPDYWQDVKRRKEEKKPKRKGGK